MSYRFNGLIIALCSILVASANAQTDDGGSYTKEFPWSVSLGYYAPKDADAGFRFGAGRSLGPVFAELQYQSFRFKPSGLSSHSLSLTTVSAIKFYTFGTAKAARAGIGVGISFGEELGSTTTAAVITLLGQYDLTPNVFGEVRYQVAPDYRGFDGLSVSVGFRF